jgi:hypothetical protein
MPDHGLTIVLVHGAFANTSSLASQKLPPDAFPAVRRRGFYPGGCKPTQRYQPSGAHSFTDIP